MPQCVLLTALNGFQRAKSCQDVLLLSPRLPVTSQFQRLGLHSQRYPGYPTCFFLETFGQVQGKPKIGVRIALGAPRRVLRSTRKDAKNQFSKVSPAPTSYKWNYNPYKWATING